MTNRSASVTAVLIALMLTAVACGETSENETTAPPTTVAPTTAAPTTVTPLDTLAPAPQSYEEFRAQPTACGAEAPPPATEQTFEAPDDMGLDPAQPVRATIETSCGDIIVELDPSIAPETVNSFVFLAEQEYFDGTAAHRVLPEFVLQAGDPTATGRGGPGYTVPDELPAQGATYERGILAMANAGPGTSGSQFFIMLADAGLPPAYSVFGRVVDGLDVLDAIATLPLGDRAAGFSVERSVPLETLYIDRVVIGS
jgi:cyclophilin family peptidyl-prolyl cis-trans isomerase